MMTLITSTFKESNYLPMLLGLTLILLSCKSDKKETAAEIEIMEQPSTTYLDILTVDMDFQMADTIPSGWTNFRYKNASTQTHFFLIDQYPEGKTSKDAEQFVAPVFDKGMKLINEGKIEEGMAAFAELPEWFSQVVFVGGSGLVSPGQVAETTINLKPGKYILECYVKMSNGVFHTSMGMTKDVVVKDLDSGNKEPRATIGVELSSTEGIILSDSLSIGEQTFKVFYKDQIVHENFVGHDISLVRLEEGAKLDSLELWMNWAHPKGLIEPAPEHVTFLGGVNDMPAGSTGYFKANLSPGNYALISEVPNARQKKLLKTFELR